MQFTKNPYEADHKDMQHLTWIRETVVGGKLANNCGGQALEKKSKKQHGAAVPVSPPPTRMVDVERHFPGSTMDGWMSKLWI